MAAGWSLDGRLTLLDDVAPPTWPALAASAAMREARAFFRPCPFARADGTPVDLWVALAALQTATTRTWCTMHVPEPGVLVVLFDERHRSPLARDPRDGVVLATRWHLAPPVPDTLVEGMCLAPCDPDEAAAAPTPVSRWAPTKPAQPPLWTPPPGPLLAHFAGAGWTSPVGRVVTLGAKVTHDVLVNDTDGTVRRLTAV